MKYDFIAFYAYQMRSKALHFALAAEVSKEFSANNVGCATSQVVCAVHVCEAFINLFRVNFARTILRDRQLSTMLLECFRFATFESRKMFGIKYIETQFCLYTIFIYKHAHYCLHNKCFNKFISNKSSIIHDVFVVSNLANCIFLFRLHADKQGVETMCTQFKTMFIFKLSFIVH